MNENLLGYALHRLDLQYKTYKNHAAVNHRYTDALEEYYKGMFTMLELIVSDGFKNDLQIERCDDNKHYIIGGLENE